MVEKKMLYKSWFSLTPKKSNKQAIFDGIKNQTVFSV